MSQPMEERVPVPSDNKKGKGPVSLERRGRYDVWSRTQSDTFRWNVAEVLCKTADLHLDRCSDPYSWFTALPSPAWDSGFTDAEMAKCQLAALFSKDEDMRSDIDQEAAAFQAFQDAEVSCKSVNDAILGGQFGVDNSDVGCVLLYAQRKIADILGEAPRIIDLKPTFGPGAAVTCRKKTSARFKLSTPPSVCNSALGILFQMVQGVRRWYDAHNKVLVVSGALEFVPKNYKTKRAIVIGPSLTGMYQRAVGRVMKQKLLKHGIDLYKGQDHQRRRAQAASLTGSDATIDLKAASDSLAYMLILELLPEKWFELLDRLRDDRVTYRNQVYHLEKFSSMGNGYTFELETLVFYALCYGIAKHYDLSVSRDEITVYGDDIIVPTRLADRLFELFPEFGFRINKEKSFVDGNFRESCGGDYVLGVDVRPFFIRNRMTHHNLVSFYNHLMRKPHQDPDRKIRELILSYVPQKFRIFGPEGFGDGHLVSAADIKTYGTPHKRELGYGGFLFETFIELPYREVPIRQKRKGPVDLVEKDYLLPAYLAHLKAETEQEVYEDLKEVSHFLAGLRGYHRLSFLRQYLEGRDNPHDVYVLRKPRGQRSRARKIRVYTYGPVE